MIRGPRPAPRTHTLLTLARLLFVAALALVGLPRAAYALGSVKAEKTTLEEVDGRWKLKMTIDHGSVPDIAFVPMLFSFEQTMHYERALTEASPDKPELIKKSLVNQQPINESMDVGFGDGSGKTFKGTKFDFVIRRDRGFEAGEYKLTIKKADGGQTMGQPIRLVLNGENPVIDRRPISFVGDKAGKDGKAKSADKPKDGADKPKKDEPSEESAPSEGALSAASTIAAVLKLVLSCPLGLCPTWLKS
jgi:hypothetical protein